MGLQFDLDGLAICFSILTQCQTVADRDTSMTAKTTLCNVLHGIHEGVSNHSTS